LSQALARGAIHQECAELAEALDAADCIYVALPIALTVELLPTIASHAGPQALVTDACSTKVAVCRAAATQFRDSARFLGGHPVAGKEVGGVENADADLFRGVKYVLIADETDPDERVQKFARLLRSIGADPVWLDAETHDWAVAIVSHLPQLVAVGLARVVLQETDESGLPIPLAARGLRDQLRLAGSPYPIWRDIALTNTENISRALDRMGQALDHLRLRLASKELKDEFAAANELYKMLEELK
jgi:prephenate dehydrogenase